MGEHEKREQVYFRGRMMSRRKFLKLFAAGAISVGAASVLGSRFTGNSITGRQGSSNPCAGNDGSGSGQETSSGSNYQMPSGEPEDFEGEVMRADDIDGTSAINRVDVGSEGFHIQNVAVIRDNPTDSHGGNRALIASIDDPDGVGVVENCYFEGGKGNNVIFVHKRHQGTLVFRNCYITRAGSDALYAETAAPRGGGGEIIVENCYFRDNNVAHVRISNGEVRDTVIHNTGNVPGTYDGAVNSRGLTTMYAGNTTVLAENVQVDVTDENTNGAAAAINIVQEGSDWEVHNSQLRGSRNDRGKATYENVGENPDIHIPDGVPGSPDDV